MRLSSEFGCAGDTCEANTRQSNGTGNASQEVQPATTLNQPTGDYATQQRHQHQHQQQQQSQSQHQQPQPLSQRHQRNHSQTPRPQQQQPSQPSQPTMRTPGEQLRELSTNDLKQLLETTDSSEVEGADGSNQDGAHLHNCTVKDLENILDKFEADAQLLLDNPDQLLNCKYPYERGLTFWQANTISLVRVVKLFLHWANLRIAYSSLSSLAVPFRLPD